MAKPQVVSPDDDIYTRTADEILAAQVNADDTDEPRIVGKAPELALPFQGNEELQSEIEAQRAFEAAPEPPMQPYTVGSSMYRNELIAKKAKLDSDIANLEGQRNGMNARIDDMNMERNAVEAGLSVLK